MQPKSSTTHIPHCTSCGLHAFAIRPGRTSQDDIDFFGGIRKDETIMAFSIIDRSPETEIAMIVREEKQRDRHLGRMLRQSLLDNGDIQVVVKETWASRVVSYRATAGTSKTIDDVKTSLNKVESDVSEFFKSLRAVSKDADKGDGDGDDQRKKSKRSPSRGRGRRESADITKLRKTLRSISVNGCRLSESGKPRTQTVLVLRETLGYWKQSVGGNRYKVLSQIATTSSENVHHRDSKCTLILCPGWHQNEDMNSENPSDSPASACRNLTPDAPPWIYGLAESVIAKEGGIDGWRIQVSNVKDGFSLHPLDISGYSEDSTDEYESEV